MKGTLFSDQILVAIDVGTTKISVLVARIIPPNQLEILGIGKVPSYGLEKGIVVDIAHAVSSIKAAVQEAEVMAGCTIESAHIGISGAHIQSQKSQGMVPLKHGEVKAADIMQVLASARAVSVPKGQQILHVLPHYFTIDGQQRVREPLGLCGIRLEVQVHIITGSVMLVNNLIKCCNLAGVNVTDIVLEQLASAYAVLSYDERHLGAAVLDIGGGTSDLAVYHKNSVLFTHVLPVAGTNFTNDLAIGLQTTLKEAERIKISSGCVIKPEIDESFELLRSDGITHQTVTQSKLVSILQPRAAELLHLVADELVHEQMHGYLPAGLVLTGGGSLLPGMTSLASSIFGTNVRLGAPTVTHAFGPTLSHPSYATGYGLLLYALQKKDTAHAGSLHGPAVMRVLARMRSWVTDLF
jgi:cell division protein FtsA